MPRDVVGAVEIAELLGITRARVNQLAAHDPTFPKPWRKLAQGRLWDLRAIERWGETSEWAEKRARAQAARKDRQKGR